MVDQRLGKETENLFPIRVVTNKWVRVLEWSRKITFGSISDGFTIFVLCYMF